MTLLRPCYVNILSFGMGIALNNSLRNPILLKYTNVLYFDQRTSALHAVHWLKSSFSAFKQVTKGKKEAKVQKLYYQEKWSTEMLYAQ